MKEKTKKILITLLFLIVYFNFGWFYGYYFSHISQFPHYSWIMNPSGLYIPGSQGSYPGVYQSIATLAGTIFFIFNWILFIIELIFGGIAALLVSQIKKREKMIKIEPNKKLIFGFVIMFVILYLTIYHSEGLEMWIESLLSNV